MDGNFLGYVLIDKRCQGNVIAILNVFVAGQCGVFVILTYTH